MTMEKSGGFIGEWRKCRRQVRGEPPADHACLVVQLQCLRQLQPLKDTFSSSVLRCSVSFQFIMFLL